MGSPLWGSQAAFDLGNQLWQVAATISRSAHDIGSRPFVVPDWEYRPYLSLPEDFYEPPERTDELIDLARDERGPYFQRLSDIDAFDPEFFAPRQWPEARFGESSWSALHVRRGDYLQKPDRFPQLTKHYYETALKQTNEYSLVAVFSDDIPWCEANARELGITQRKHVFVPGHVRPVAVSQRTGEPTDINDLFLMACASTIVIANSTFSWWAAYLSRAQVFYPDRWFGPDVEEFTGFPAHWTRVPC